MEYTWKEFNLDDAIAGTLVGIKNAQKPYDLSMTGKIYALTRFSGGGGLFRVSFDGYIVESDLEGKVTSCKPSNAAIEGSQLQMVTAEMGNNGSVGSTVTRGDGSEKYETVDINDLNPRDHFAMNALTAMLVHTDHPETFDDATCLMYSRAAYRWAQAMMIAAADSREVEKPSPE